MCFRPADVLIRSSLATACPTLLQVLFRSFETQILHAWCCILRTSNVDFAADYFRPDGCILRS